MGRTVGAMKTPDGWLVEVYRKPMSREHWFRVLRDGEVVDEQATIGMVQDLLGDSYADLVTGEPNQAA